MKIGDYVRTDYGLIGKIFEKYRGIQNATIYKVNVPNEDFDYTNVFEFEVVKSSPNILDLIEVGDYVNRHRVLDVDLHDIDDLGNDFRYIKTEHYFELNHWVKEYEIKSIVTKEQFESMEFHV